MSWLEDKVHELVLEINDKFPYVPGYYVKIESGEPIDYNHFDTDNAYLKLTAHYEPIIYFEDD